MMKRSMLAASAMALAAVSGMPAAVATGGLPSASATSAGSSAPHSADTPAKPQKSPSTRAGDTNGPLGWSRRSGSRSSYPKPGFSVRQGQRMAAKRRNVLANRRAQR